MKTRDIRRITEHLRRLGFGEVRQGFRFRVGEHIHYVDMAATNGSLTAIVAYGSSPIDSVDRVVGMFNLAYYWSQRLRRLVLINVTAKVESCAPTPSAVREAPLKVGSRLNRESFEYVEMKGSVTVEQLAKKLGLSKKTAGTWLSRWVKAGYLSRGTTGTGGTKGRPRAHYTIGPKWWGEKVFASERLIGI